MLNGTTEAMGLTKAGDDTREVGKASSSNSMASPIEVVEAIGEEIPIPPSAADSEDAATSITPSLSRKSQRLRLAAPVIAEDPRRSR